MRRRVRTFLIGLAVVIGLVLVVEFTSIYRYLWVGGYDLTVHIDSPNDLPTAVGCYPMSHRDDAESLCSRSPNPRELRQVEPTAFVEPFTGQPLKVHIKTTGQDSAFGRNVSRDQERFLVVSAEWRDGRRVCKVVEIPDGRKSREVRVVVP